MQPRMLGVVSLICLVVTILWLVLMIWGIVSVGTVETFEQALAHVAEPDALFFLTYVNATLVTLFATMLLAGLYVYFRPIAPEWSAIGLVFVPVYCVLNLFVYVSQITIVPRLLAFQGTAEYQDASSLLLGQMVQLWPGSAVATLNTLAYAILGIPSIIFGMGLVKQGTSKQLSGILLALNGLACIVGMVGFVVGSDLLEWGTSAGGVLFLLALIPLSLAFLREE